MKETYEELETKKFLDSLPWKEYLSLGKDLYDIMDEIQQTYGDSLEDNPVFRGEVFNWMSTDDFADYLRDKGIHVWEEYTTTYTIGEINL